METSPEYKRLFSKHKKPCPCKGAWYQWHYYATQLGRYKKPFVKLCDECALKRRAKVRECKGNVTEADKTRIRKLYPTTRREPYPRNGKLPTSLHKGFIQEHDLETGLPKSGTGRVINRFAYDSDDGTSVSGKSTPRGKPSEAPAASMRYLEDAERPTQHVTAYQDDRYRPDAENSSEICESDDDESDTDWVKGKGKGKGKEREKSAAPPPGTKRFHRVEDKELRIDDPEWVEQRAELLKIFKYAEYSAEVDDADAELEEAAVGRGSEIEHDDGQTESSMAPISVVSSSLLTDTTVSSVPSRRRSVRFRDDSEDEYESGTVVSSVMDRLRMQGRR